MPSGDELRGSQHKRDRCVLVGDGVGDKMGLNVQEVMIWR